MLQVEVEQLFRASLPYFEALLGVLGTVAHSITVQFILYCMRCADTNQTIFVFVVRVGLRIFFVWAFS